MHKSDLDYSRQFLEAEVSKSDFQKTEEHTHILGTAINAIGQLEYFNSLDSGNFTVHITADAQYEAHIVQFEITGDSFSNYHVQLKCGKCCEIIDEEEDVPEAEVWPWISSRRDY